MKSIQEKINAFLTVAQEAVSTTGEGWDESYSSRIVTSLSKHISVIHPALGSLIRLSNSKMTIVLFDGSLDNNGACSKALDLLSDTDLSDYDELECQQITSLEKVSEEYPFLDSEWKSNANHLIKQSNKAILITGFPWRYFETQSIRMEGHEEINVLIS